MNWRLMKVDKNKYLVALCVGGIMECPEISYKEVEVIEADTKEEAEEIYNTKNKCSYFYGSCLAENVNGNINILNKQITYEMVEMLK